MSSKKSTYSIRIIAVSLALLTGSYFALAFSYKVLSFGSETTNSARVKAKTDAVSKAEKSSVDKKSNFFHIVEKQDDSPFVPVSDRLLFGSGTVASYPNLYGTINSVVTSGSGNTPAIVSAVNDIEPAFSPDGKKIVFISFRDGVDNNNNPDLTNREIYIMNVDGTDQRRLTFNDQPEEQPIFSPDGTKIIYVSTVEDGSGGGGSSGVYSMNLDGSNQTLLFDDSCTNSARKISKLKNPKTQKSDYYPGILGIDTPNYSPNGSKIVFGYGDVYQFDVASGICSFLTATNSYGSNVAPEPHYSPDGTKVALVDAEEVYNPDTEEYEYVNFLRIINSTGTNYGEYHPEQFYSTPVWSPTGTKIAYFGSYGGFYGADQVEIYDLNSHFSTQIYFPAQVHFFSGMSWGFPFPTPPPMSMFITPSPQISGGQTVQGHLNFNSSLVPPEGATINLSIVGENAVLELPQTTISVVQGQSSATFNINALPQSVYKSADVVATLGGNSARFTVSVIPGGTPKPDLQALSLTAPDAVDVGASLPVSWTVKNIGTVATPNFYIDRVYFSIDNQVNSNDVELASKNQTALGAGQQRTSSATTLINSTLVPQSGQYYLIFVTNVGGIVDEGSGNYANNIIVRPIQINLPDVVAENVVVPAQIEPGVNYNFSYTVHNVGQAGTPTNDTFLNKFYFSEDDIAGNADDILLDQYFQNPLAAGQTATRNITNKKIPTTPVRSDGQKFFYVVVDTEDRVKEGSATGAGETNNTTFQATQFFYHVPDLQVSSTLAPAEVDSDTDFAVQWTTTNAGNRNAGAFNEKVFFSLDNQVGGDVQLGSFALPQGLNAGASIERIQNVRIPTSSISQTGDYFVYVKTDDANQIDEGENENNNVRFYPLHVRRILLPDLQITNITAPSEAFFDQTVQVQWTVKNTGAGPTNAPQWRDTLYISPSPTISDTSIKLLNSTSISYLNAGESYTASATVKIPRGISGTYYFIVKTDSFGQLNEENTTNNTLNKVITVNVPTLPDLIVSNVQVPTDTAFAGQEILISYTITNQGTGTANRSREKIYLSRDTVLDSQDRLFFTGDYGATLAPNQSYTVTSKKVIAGSNPIQYETARLPQDVTGNWYVFVEADASDSVYEYTNENNNTNYDRAAPGSPLNVLVSPPDLVVQNAPNAPNAAVSSQTIPVSFVVKNQGAFGAPNSFYDAVYLSADQTFDANDTFLGSVKRDGLSAGTEYTADFNVQIPNCATTGTYYLIAYTDYSKKQFEYDPNFDAEANNASPAKQIQITANPPDLRVTNLQFPPITTPGQAVSVTWTVTNAGSGAANQNWNDRIVLYSTTPDITPVQIGLFGRPNTLAAGANYTQTKTIGLPAYMQGEYFLAVTTDYNNYVPECGTSENNNTTNSAPFTVQNNLPDLVIDSVTVPNAASVADLFNVQWTGRNANQAMPANSSSWSDQIYLSTNQTLSNDDKPIGSAVNTTILAAGQTYQKQIQVRAGNVAAGNYYILVAADNGKNIYEGAADTPPETNNVKASIPITLFAPTVDLQVVSTTVPQPTYSGTNTVVSWTVQNFGMTDTLGSYWTDYIILSRDAVYDSTDTVLGYAPHSEALTAGANYQISKGVYIPTGLTGDYNIFVYTDYGNRIAENNDANNVGAPFAVNLQLPPPADLNVTNISVPANIQLGQSASFSWTVQNSGPNSINGSWRDTVYLSRDAFWDASDILVGQSERNQALGVTQTYTAGYGGAIPPVEEGTYYVIVRTDSQNRIREGNEANNVSASVATTNVSITELQINTPLNTTLGNGEQKFFKFEPPPLETIIVSLMSDKPTRKNELFTKFNSIVSRADYDFQGSRQGEANQENIIPETGDGTYYSMVRTDFIPNSFAKQFEKSSSVPKSTDAPPVEPQNITVKAEILPFSIRQVSPTIAGNAGYATLTIEGAKFKTGATVKLVGANNSVILPLQAKISTAKIAAIFDLKGKPAGVYDVVVQNPDNATTTLDDGFQIVNGGGHSLRPTATGPRKVDFTRRRIHYTFTASNDGLNDAVRVPIFITMPIGMTFELDKSNYIETSLETLPEGITQADIAPDIIIDGKRVVMFIAPIIRSKGSVDINMDLIFSSLSTQDLAFAVLPPLDELLAKSYTESQSGDPSQLVRFAPSNAREDACYADLARQIILAVIGLFGPDDSCLSAAFGAGSLAADVGTGAALNNIAGDGSYGKKDVIESAVPSLIGIAEDVVRCIGATFPPTKIVLLAWTMRNLMAKLTDCLKIPLEINIGRGNSYDPNEKIGPEGYGAEKFVPVGQPMLYQINFENKAEATAAAQRIYITDVLPPTLDARTVKLKEIGFKQNRIVIPDNQAFYQSRINLGADLNNLDASISAGLDLQNNQIFWTLTAIDPQTGEQPLDPDFGLLPPNNENHDGEGYVIFTVEPKASFPNRTEINNIATIYFDENEPIATNTTANLLDSQVPSSVVAALPATSDSTDFNVTWTSNDDADGSGFKRCEVRASENNGGFLPALSSETLDGSEIFRGKWGKTYRFYSIASDNAGNYELPPTMPDAVIKIRGGDTEGDVAPRPDGNDGQVADDDIGQIRRFVAGLDTNYQFNEFQRADIAPLADKGDGVLTVADVIQARRFKDGLDVIAEAAGPNEPQSFNAKTANGNNAPLSTREIRPVYVNRTGNKLIVAVELNAQGDEAGIGFTLNFNTAHLSNPSNIMLGSGATGATLTVNNPQTTNGRLGILIDKAPNQNFGTGVRQLVTIEFDVLPNTPMSTQIAFDDQLVKQQVVKGSADTLPTTFSAAPVTLLAPTAASVSISGRVMAGNQGVYPAFVDLTDAAGRVRIAPTNPSGNYRFDNVEAGQTYIIGARSKRYSFQTRVFAVNEDLVNFNFVAQ